MPTLSKIYQGVNLPLVPFWCNSTVFLDNVFWVDSCAVLCGVSHWIRLIRLLLLVSIVGIEVRLRLPSGCTNVRLQVDLSTLDFQDVILCLGLH